MRKFKYASGSFYHIFNRGVEKRSVFLNNKDLERFIESMIEFNTNNPVGGIYARALLKKEPRHSMSRLVNVVAYCLNPNHFHVLLEQVTDGGISEFMRRLGGYTKYFNSKYKRSGVLFQGTYKSKHINTNAYLSYVSAYINLNDRVHTLNPRHSMSRSSWLEYLGKSQERQFCSKEIILDQFKNPQEYKEFAEEALENMLEKKKLAKELEELFLE